MDLPQFDHGEAIVLVVFLSVGLTALSGVLDLEPLSGVFAILGFAVLLPLTVVLGDTMPFVGSSDEESSVVDEDATDEVGEDAGEEDHAVAALRERYARGEIDEAEFERRLDALLETREHDETVDSGDELATEFE